MHFLCKSLKLRKLIFAVFNGERGTATSLLELLPQEFTTAELIKLRARKGQSVLSNAIKVLLHRWKTNGRIDKISDGHWKRLG